jgi:hypothetical protein
LPSSDAYVQDTLEMIQQHAGWLLSGMRR